MGHFANACRFPKQYSKNINATVDTIGQAENVHDTQVRSETDFAFHINSVNKGANKHIMVEVFINGKPILMQVDTAADISIMSEKTAKNIPNLLLEGTNRVLKGYNGFDIRVTGASNVEVQYKEKNLERMPLTVIIGNGQTLLGLDWLQCLKLDWPGILMVTRRQDEHINEISVDNIISEFQDVLEDKVGLFRPKRLPYGVASSPAIWQQTMVRIFPEMQGVFIFKDILIAGKDTREH
ncbi:uncharacterized protein [Palaemon carinicauda]|uniref:uncharacterized protein n=1 Tax=Palaemon carinicauda TaxID=392227 RepID=UPI0035B5FC7D